MKPLWEAAELSRVLGVNDVAFNATGISFDTRSLKPGDLFVALEGERDGHDFVPEALAKGAAGAVVSRPFTGAALQVPHTLAALQTLAAAARGRSEAKIVAVTGSVGKTTTKEMLRRALSAFGSVHAAPASFNNQIGVAVTLATLPADADFGVLEIGMNHKGEIAPLAQLSLPHVGIITTIEPVHVGHLGSTGAIATEKARIFSGIVPYGVAVLPSDSPHYGTLRAAVGTRTKTITFGQGRAQAKLLNVVKGADFCEMTADIEGETVRVRLGAPGHHMAMNALAALGACAGLGLDLQKAAAALDGFTPVAGRGHRRQIKLDGGTVLLLDESYNASAPSIRAALNVLSMQAGRHIAVLGDILELGDHAANEHAALLPSVVASADIVFACGELMKPLFDSLPASMRCGYAKSAEDLIPLIRAALRPGDAVLVKGSNSMRMREIVAALEQAD